MPEFFINGNTFAAPFISEQLQRYIQADTPEIALEGLSDSMKDGVGLFAASAYASADDYHKNRKPLATWHSNKARSLQRTGLHYSDGPDRVQIDGEWHEIDDPKGGRLVYE